MRRIQPRRALLLGALAATLALAGAGSPKKKVHTQPKKPFKTEETIGNITFLASAGEIKVEGVGLVIGLSDTGSDPEPSYYRQKLTEQMQKAGVEDVDKWLALPSTSLVLVKAKIPAGVTMQDHLDAEIELTPSSATTSLAGGTLLATRLTEVMIGKNGTAHEGSVLAVAGGPVMIGNAAKADDPKVGRVLGGCHVKKDMPHALVIDENHKSIRTAQIVEGVINQRFHHQVETDAKGMASAKTEVYLTLKVPKLYHQNQQRYFQVIKLLPVVDNPTLRAQRIEKWSKELLDPKTAGVAALRLEGVGQAAVEPLKAALANPSPQVRFFAAEALAYLDDTTGIDVLADTAIRQPKFRAFALAALASMGQAGSTLQLRKLMDHPEFEVRYGAFNSLRTQDPNDAYLGRVPLFDEEPEPKEEDTPQELRIGGSRRRAARPPDPFELYVVDCEGPPIVHISRNRRCEVVIFGKSQKILTPVVLGSGGPVLLNASDGDDTVQVSRIVRQRLDDPDFRVSSSRELGEIVRHAAQLGATYPQVVNILMAARDQKNLPGPLVIDAVPLPDPKYDEAQLVGTDATAKKDDALRKANVVEKRPRGVIDRLLRRNGR